MDTIPEKRGCTVIVDEVCNRDAEQCAIEARVEARYPFSLDDASDRVVS